MGWVFLTNYTLTAKDPKQQGYRGSGTGDPSGVTCPVGGLEPGGLDSGGLEPGGLEAWTTDSGAGSALTGLGGLEPGGLEPGGLESGGLEPGGLEAWRPILELAAHSPVL